MSFRVASFITILLILNIILFHNNFLKKIFVLNLQKVTEKKIFIQKVDLNFKKKLIILNDVKIYNSKDFSYKYFFTSKKIIIKPALNTIFKNVVEFQNLIFHEPTVFLEIKSQFIDDNKVSVNKDNYGQAEKSLPSYEPKTYPEKKKDRNILIKKIITYKPKVYFKYANIYKIENLNLSEMEISNVGNSEESSQHFKEVFKFILLDFYLKIPNFKIKKDLKKIYKL